MSLRERLAARALPTQTVTFPADRAVWDAAHQELLDAEAAVRQHRRGGEPPQDVLDRRDAAQAAVDGLERDVWEVRTLPPHEWEALVSAHPAAEDADHGWAFDPGSFNPVLLAEVVSCGGEQLDADWWAKPEGLTPGEVTHLTNVALNLNANVAVVSDAVGKGSPPTRS